MSEKVSIGILAVQGAFAEHQAMLDGLGAVSAGECGVYFSVLQPAENVKRSGKCSASAVVSRCTEENPQCEGGRISENGFYQNIR